MTPIYLPNRLAQQKKGKKTCVHQHHQSQDDKFATNEVPAIFPCQIVYLCRRRALFGFSQGKKKPKATADPMVISVQKTPKEMEIISQRCDVPV